MIWEALGLVIAVVVFTLVALGVLTPPVIGDHSYRSGIIGSQLGGSGAMVGVCIYYLLHDRWILKDEKRLEQHKLKCYDERLQFIHMKAGYWPVIWSCYGCLILGVISAYFNIYVFFSLMACAYLLLIMELLLIWYYKKKY